MFRAPATRRTLAALAASAMLLVGCSGASSDTAAPSGAGTLTVSDPWLKAATDVDANEITAAFAVLTNSGSAPVQIVSATNSASDRTEVHEMAMVGGAMSMTPVQGGLTVPAGGTLELEPGGFHLMVLDLQKAVSPGASVHFTLTLDTGAVVEFDALAKEFSGAQESYAPDPHNGHHG